MASRDFKSRYQVGRNRIGFLKFSSGNHLRGPGTGTDTTDREEEGWVSILQLISAIRIYKKKEKQKNWPTQAHCATMGKSTVSTFANLHCATMGAVNCWRNGTHIGTYVCSGTYLYVIGTEQIFRNPTYILWRQSAMTLANLWIVHFSKNLD